MFQSSLLNTNLRAYTSWKGKTFGQVTSSIQKNNHPNIHRLPETLEDCLQQLEHDLEFIKKFDHHFLRSYLAVKHYEVRLLHGRSEAELIQLHTKHY